MSNARVSQIVIETAGTPQANARVSQIVIETAGTPKATAHVSQIVLEVAVSTAPVIIGVNPKPRAYAYFNNFHARAQWRPKPRALASIVTVSPVLGLNPSSRSYNYFSNFHARAQWRPKLSTRASPVAAPTPTSTHQFWRLVNTSPQSSSDYVCIAEIEMYANESSTNLCVGGTATASSSNGAQTPNLAFDQDVGTYWQSGGNVNDWIAYAFTSAQNIGYIAIRAVPYDPGSGSLTVARCVGTFLLEYSDNNVAWYLFNTYVATPFAAAQRQIFLVGGAPPLEAGARFWRVRVTGNNYV